MAPSKKTQFRDNLGMQPQREVKSPLQTAFYFALLTTCLNFVFSWLIFRNNLKSSLLQEIPFFLMCLLLMWGYLAWKKNQQHRLR